MRKRQECPESICSDSDYHLFKNHHFKIHNLGSNTTIDSNYVMDTIHWNANNTGVSFVSGQTVPESNTVIDLDSGTNNILECNTGATDFLTLSDAGGLIVGEVKNPQSKVLEKGPLESVFPCSTSKILDFLISFQEFDYSISDISKNSGVGFKTTLNETHKLENKGVVIRARTVGKAIMYKLNLDSEIGKSISRLALDLAMKNAEEKEDENKNPIAELQKLRKELEETQKSLAQAKLGITIKPGKKGANDKRIYYRNQPITMKELGELYALICKNEDKLYPKPKFKGSDMTSEFLADVRKAGEVTAEIKKRYKLS